MNSEALTELVAKWRQMANEYRYNPAAMPFTADRIGECATELEAALRALESTPAQEFVDLDALTALAIDAWVKHKKSCRITTVDGSLRKVAEAFAALSAGATLPRGTGSDAVLMPVNKEQARAMALIGHAWLRDNAPELLTTHVTPELPEPIWRATDGVSEGVYTRDQLIAYGQACASARTAPAEGEPDPALLVSMATCLNHGFGLLETSRQESILHDMRKLWDEVQGRGYYKPERRDYYMEMVDTARTAKAEGDGNG
jgi:hypothetical protein